ncbi:MAG: anthranilate synthase component II [Oligosphaeraceae bacterium]
MIYMIDNYDSFTYNLVQYLQMLGAEVVVRRNDEVSVEEVLTSGAAGVVLSPGPGRPDEAGIMLELIRRGGDMPMLGVCLGHQAIGAAFGARIIHAKQLMHGKLSTITHDGQGVFKGLPETFQAVRYHSLAIDESSLPDCLVPTAHSEDGELMGVRHTSRPLEGIQYHPESILSQNGKRQLRNFLTLVQDRSTLSC